jgi:Phage tail sheath C-terminal domain
MALTSPGVQVTVIDESFYNTGIPGTVPIIFVATKANKTNPSGTVAKGTLASYVGKVWTITSQRDLTDTFGTPLFYTDSNSNPIHGGELNEYGLQAAYSTLGVSSRAYVVRANLDLAEITPTSSEPKGRPVSGSYWLDTTSSLFGISEWDATNKVFVNKVPLKITDDNKDIASKNGVPLASYGAIGNYAVYATSENAITIWFKNWSNVWVKLGSSRDTSFGSPISGPTFTSKCWQTSWPVVSGLIGTPITGKQFNINGIAISIGGITADAIATAINASCPNAGVAANSDGTRIYLYADASAFQGGRISLTDSENGAVLASLGLGRTGTVYGEVKLSVNPHTIYPQFATDKVATGSVYVKTTEPGRGAKWTIKTYNAGSAAWTTVTAPIYPNHQAALYALDSTGGTSLTAGKLFVKSNTNDGTYGAANNPGLANFEIYRRTSSSPTTIAVTVGAGISISTGSQFLITETIAGSSSLPVAKTVTITSTGTAGTVVAAAISSAGLINVTASYDSNTRVLKVSHKLGGDILLTDAAGAPLQGLGFYDPATTTYAANLYPENVNSVYQLRASNWKPIDLLTTPFVASATAPTTAPAEGTIWYSSIQDEVDIMIHNGTNWVGYLNYLPQTDPNGPIIRATQPDAATGQSDGTPLVDGDIWIDSSDPEMYGQTVYVWSTQLAKWIKQDLTDNTSPTGWLFADARWSGAGDDVAPDSVQKLLSYNYVDPDAPDPVQYPQGMRLWNTRRSGNNVKKYMSAAIDITANSGKNTRYNDEIMDGSTGNAKYSTARWVNDVGNNEDGSGKFGRHAQRGLVVKSLKSLIDTNSGVRDTDTLIASLIVTPGYPETITNMVNLNTARGLTAFVIGDTPMRLPATGTDLRTWGGTNSALDNGETGAVTYDEYMAMYYPSGFTTDNSGNNIMVPPSHMILRTISISDQRSYPWFAPAGTRRGGVDNATAVGYLKDGEFQLAPIPQNLRDVLQDVKINPISTIPGSGIVVFGQKTRARNASALDRINVSRLVAYLRRQLDVLTRPFLFEPNDRITRNEMKQSVESLLLELVGQRALYDFIVQCDEQNNTPARIDRNELYVDIAIEPVKAVEFIYIPLRLKNTGDIAAGL